MMSSNLDTADLPDTLSQSSVPATREMRSPSELTSRLLALFACPRQRARRLLRNNEACASLIGRCTSSPMSLTRVVGCAGTARLSCYYKHTATSCRHFVSRNKTVCRSAMLGGKLRKVVNMNNDRSRAVGGTSSSTDSSPESYGDNLPPPDLLHRRPAQITPSRFVGPFRGLGLPHRGAFGQARNPMAARCPRKGPRGGRGAKRGYQPRTCGLCGNDRVYNSRTSLNNHTTKQHGCYYSLKRDCLVPIDQTDLQAHIDRIVNAQHHHYPYGMGPRSRGRAMHGRGRGACPRPPFTPSLLSI